MWVLPIFPPTACFSAQQEEQIKADKLTCDQPLRSRGISRLTENSAGSRDLRRSHGSAKWHLRCRYSTRVTHPHHCHLPWQELWWLESGSNSQRKQTHRIQTPAETIQDFHCNVWWPQWHLTWSIVHSLLILSLWDELAQSPRIGSICI